MRKIKFRCYDKNEGYMLTWEHLVQAGDLREMLLHGHKEDADYSKLMQFTGLKDKNGVEIYEGDIVKFEYGSTPSVTITGWGHDVVDGKYYRETHDVKYEDGTFLLGNHIFYSFDKLLDQYSLEIIGSIYKNPELLNAQK